MVEAVQRVRTIKFWSPVPPVVVVGLLAYWFLHHPTEMPKLALGTEAVESGHYRVMPVQISHPEGQNALAQAHQGHMAIHLWRPARVL